MLYAKFSLLKYSSLQVELSHLLPRRLFAKHANATKPYANVLDLLIIPRSSCNKWTASQAFRDIPDIFVSGHLHQPATLLSWVSTAAAPGRESAIFLPWVNSCSSSCTLPRGLCLRLSEELKSAFALAHIPYLGRQGNKWEMPGTAQLKEPGRTQVSKVGSISRQKHFMKLLHARQHNCFRKGSRWPLEREVHHSALGKSGYPQLKKIIGN